MLMDGRLKAGEPPDPLHLLRASVRNVSWNAQFDLRAGPGLASNLKGCAELPGSLAHADETEMLRLSINKDVGTDSLSVVANSDVQRSIPIGQLDLDSFRA